MPYKISYRPIKYPRLEFRTGELLIILPPGTSPDTLLRKYKHWIGKQSAFIKECLEATKDRKLYIRSDEEFRRLVHHFAEDISRDLAVTLNRIFFRRMRTKWASLSSARNLTVNTLMRYLPEHLIEYVAFHEITHIIEKRHNERFWNIISSRFKDYQEMEKEMFIYWFLI